MDRIIEEHVKRTAQNCLYFVIGVFACLAVGACFIALDRQIAASDRSMQEARVQW